MSPPEPDDTLIACGADGVRWGPAGRCSEPSSGAESSAGSDPLGSAAYPVEGHDLDAVVGGPSGGHWRREPGAVVRGHAAQNPGHAAADHRAGGVERLDAQAHAVRRLVGLVVDEPLDVVPAPARHD